MNDSKIKYAGLILFKDPEAVLNRKDHSTTIIKGFT